MKVIDLSQEGKSGRWQLVKCECLSTLKGGQVQEVSALLEGGHTTWRRQDGGDQRLLEPSQVARGQGLLHSHAVRRLAISVGVESSDQRGIEARL